MPFEKHLPKTLCEHDFNLDVTQFLTSLIKHDNLNIVLIGNSGKTTIMNNLVADYFRGFDKSVIDSNIMHINILNEHGSTFFRNNLTVFCQVNSCIPTRKKIVRIDNLDMISEQNQYVIRSLFDKYGHNVHFVCCANACTRIIEQLQSRLSLLKLNMPTPKVMSQILNRIAKHHKLKLSKDVTEYITVASKQNVSRMLGFLEKLWLCGLEPTLETVASLCDGISPCIFKEYTRLCVENRTKDAVMVILSVFEDGYSSIDIFDEYYHYIRTNTELSRELTFHIIKVIAKYTQMFYETYEHKITFVFFTNDIVKMCRSKISTDFSRIYI
jgi:DNA polymerase III delta prime subunit